MTNQIASPAEIPLEVSDYWHDRWCEILSNEYREEIVAAGLTGTSFTERSPDAPGGQGGFNFAIDAEGRIAFVAEEGEAVAEYGSYEFGYRLLADPEMDAAPFLEDGSFRIVSGAERWADLMKLRPLFREVFYRAVEQTEKDLDVELPRCW
jgi:hypothetical protein